MSPLGFDGAEDFSNSAAPNPTSGLQDASEVDVPEAEGAEGLGAAVLDQTRDTQEEEGNESQAEVPIEEEKVGIQKQGNESQEEVPIEEEKVEGNESPAGVPIEEEKVELEEVKEGEPEEVKDPYSSSQHDVEMQEDGYGNFSGAEVEVQAEVQAEEVVESKEVVEVEGEEEEVEVKVKQEVGATPEAGGRRVQKKMSKGLLQ